MEIAWNVQNCVKLIFSDSPHHHKGFGLGSNAQNNVMSETKYLLNCPQPFPIGRLPNISFLCRSGQFTQFPAKMFSLKIEPYPTSWGVGISEWFSAQIWIFNIMPIKNNCILTPSHSHVGWELVNVFCTDQDLLVKINLGGFEPHPTTPMRKGVGNIIFLCRFGHFIQFLASNFCGRSICHPSKVGWWVGKHEFSVQVWIFHAFPNKEKCCKSIPSPWVWRVGKHGFSV